MTSNHTRPRSAFRALLATGVLLATLISSNAAPLQLIDLGALNGYDSYADYLNNTGLVVGRSDPYLFAWDAAHGTTVIEGITNDYRYFRGLTDSGFAVVYAFGNNGNQTFVWSRSTGTIKLPDFGEGIFPEAINESGQVTGNVSVQGVSYPYIWDRIHGLETLPTPGYAVGINAAGVITVWGQDNSGYVWDRAHGLVSLGSINGSAFYPQLINNAGEIAGQVQFSDGSIKVAVWDRTNGLTEIWTVEPGVFNFKSFNLRSFNNNGQLLGNVVYLFDMSSSYTFVADRFNGLRKIGSTSAYVVGQNNLGTVCGTEPSVVGDYVYSVGMVWDSVRGIRSIGSLAGLDSYPNGINSRGQVVGSSATSPQSRSAFLWDESTGIRDLGGLGGDYSSADQISDAGIIGFSQTSTGEYHAFFISLATNSTPDLQISAVSAVNNQAPQGSKVTIFATVKNAGPGNAPATTTLITANGATLGSIATPAIAAGQSVTVSVDWRTAAQNGDYTLTARADSANVVAESNETNNTKSIAVTLKGNKIR